MKRANDLSTLLARAAAGAAEGLLAVADEQTAGRGRLARTWWAPPGSNLLMSLLLRPSIPPSQAGQLTMCLGLAAVEGIETVTGLRPALKWPNDLLLNGRKLGGMLSELRLDGERLDYAVLGLGLNVNLAFGGPDVPADIAATAISLSAALGRPVDRLSLLVAILARCETWYDRLLSGAFPHRAWADRLDTLGRAVTVMLPNGPLCGVATGVTPEGALLVRDAAGRVQAVWSGDVTAVRNAVP
ncbi:MAG: biotin--[acetyl-CoA-carboxylase] ligase [Chloroflexi bacterium HGW-Chloroflexi-1]|nr:MAG: biotin--[acetyl-CoA-carboxylase] ligase [Chloroflexi bacterium HGW-Chloroflexi-1]